MSLRYFKDDHTSVGFLIARTHPHPEPRHLGNAFEEKDARLFAASEDLLAALESCLGYLKRYAATHGPGPDRRLAEAMAAIARARGETP
jgi:hypothetical protein